MSQLDNTKACAAKAGMDFEVISSCASGEEGKAVLAEFGEKTGTHQYVPWVLVDGEVAGEYSDFTKFICSKYDGDDAVS